MTKFRVQEKRRLTESFLFLSANRMRKIERRQVSPDTKPALNERHKKIRIDYAQEFRSQFFTNKYIFHDEFLKAHKRDICGEKICSNSLKSRIHQHFSSGPE